MKRDREDGGEALTNIDICIRLVHQGVQNLLHTRRVNGSRAVAVDAENERAHI